MPIFVWRYSCLHPCQILALFLRYPYPEHSQCHIKVLWSAFFCLRCPTTWNSLHLHSDINRNLIASSGLWKLICFLWINVTIMFSMLLCYYVLLFMFFGLCFVRFMGHVGACSTKCSWDVLPSLSITILVNKLTMLLHIFTSHVHCELTIYKYSLKASIWLSIHCSTKLKDHFLQQLYVSYKRIWT